MSAFSDDTKKILLSSFFLSPNYKPQEGDAVETIQLQQNQNHIRNPNHSYMKKCFQAVVDRKHLLLPPEVAKHILTDDLGVSLTDHDFTLQHVLMDSLIYLMAVWPGWKKCIEYFKGELNHKEFYHKFFQYLSLHINNIITNSYKYKAKVQKSSANKVDKEVITEFDEASGYKPESPFALEIRGTPSLLNSVIFFEENNDVILKKYAIKPWKDITFQQLINYPFVALSVKCQDIHFMRSIEPDYKRYISFSNDVPVTHNEEFIHYMTPMHFEQPGKSEVFSYEFVEAYFTRYVELAKSIYGQTYTLATELEIICKEFLQDIKEINVYDCTIASRVSICYNIGRFKYVRNKKMSGQAKPNQQEPKSINFCETVTPKAVICLVDLPAEQDLNAQSINFKFKLLEANNSSFFKNLVTIQYTCMFCSVTFLTKDDIVSHLATMHNSEQDIVCFRCKKQYEMVQLAGCRWKHNCT